MWTPATRLHPFGLSAKPHELNDPPGQARVITHVLNQEVDPAMAEASTEKKSVTVPVLAYFHNSDPETGDTVFYHPDGDYNEKTGKGWPGAVAVFTGDPDSKTFQHLRAGAGADQGPLIGDPGEFTGDAAGVVAAAAEAQAAIDKAHGKPVTVIKKPTPNAGSTGKEN